MSCVVIVLLLVGAVHAYDDELEVLLEGTSSFAGRQDCAKYNPNPQVDKIVGGVSSKRGEFPWQGSLKRSGRHFCGGTLISESWVVTATHCIDAVSINQVRVTVGDHRLNGNDAGQKDYSVSRVVNAPRSDLSLVKLSSRVKLSSTVKAARLPDKYSDN